MVLILPIDFSSNFAIYLREAASIHMKQQFRFKRKNQSGKSSRYISKTYTWQSHVDCLYENKIVQTSLTEFQLCEKGYHESSPSVAVKKGISLAVIDRVDLLIGAGVAALKIISILNRDVTVDRGDIPSKPQVCCMKLWSDSIITFYKIYNRTVFLKDQPKKSESVWELSCVKILPRCVSTS